MGGSLGTRILVGAWAILVFGCGEVPREEEVVDQETPAEEAEAPPEAPPEETETPRPDGGVEVAPIDEKKDEEPPRPVPPMFQPGFHQALRGSHGTGSATFRLRVPVARAGQRVRLAFRSGDGSLVLRKVTLARAGPNGSLASAPVAVTFSGAPGFSVGARTRVVSDPVDFPVGFREELAVSFEVQGALAASNINALPGGYVRSGAYASVPGPLGGTAWERAVGLATVDVEGPPSRAFVALGDSITEGYYGDHNDTRLAWAGLAEAQLGVPIVNAGVSGQGFYDARMNLDKEVLVLSGITDCILLLGTNDLAALPVDQLQARMNGILEQLKPFCRTWVGTLLPKERSQSNYEEMRERRVAMNAWFRGMPDVIDFEAVTRSPTDVHRFLEGLGADGIHPSREGHRVMANEAARVLREKGVQKQAGVQIPSK
jgi:lysophospholipase L1-like esterase